MFLEHCKKAGRKAKSYDYGPFIRVYVPVYDLSAILPKTETLVTNIYKEDFPKIKDKLEKEGYKKIIAREKDPTFLPRSCPKCGELGGHPILQRYNRVRSQRDPNKNIISATRFKLYYNHSKPKYHQCFIGYLIGGSYWQLSKKIDPRKMYPNFLTKNNQIEWFETPKLRRLKKLS